MKRPFANFVLFAAISTAGFGLTGCGKGNAEKEKATTKAGKELTTEPKDKGPGPEETTSATDRPHVSVLFAETDKAQFADVKKGDRVKVKGDCGGIYGGKRVPISVAQRYTGKEPAISAEQLTKEFVTDEANADKKYRNKSIIVEGVVAERGELSFVLEGFK